MLFSLCRWTRLLNFQTCLASMIEKTDSVCNLLFLITHCARFQFCCSKWPLPFHISVHKKVHTVIVAVAKYFDLENSMA